MNQKVTPGERKNKRKQWAERGREPWLPS